MQLLAIAGGAGPGGEDLLLCCGMCPVLPLVVVLAGLAAVRDYPWAAVAALLLASLPYLLLRAVVAGYQASDDGDVRADQESGRGALAFYGWLLAAAGAAAAWVAVRRLVRSRRARHAGPFAAADGGGPTASPDV